MKKRLTRAEEIAQRLGELQDKAVKYAADRSEYRTADLGRAAERYVASIEATMKNGADKK